MTEEKKEIKGITEKTAKPELSGLKKLQTIQLRLNGDKNLYNKFGKYMYRNLESLLQKIKPLLVETETVVMFNDYIDTCGGWHYVYSVCSLVDMKTRDTIASSTGYAREPETYKGMSAAQITGACSSYARKYAMCALFAVSPAPDLDEIEPEQQKQEQQKEKNNPLKAMENILVAKGINVVHFCTTVFKRRPENLSKGAVENFLNRPDAAIQAYMEIVKNEGKN